METKNNPNHEKEGTIGIKEEPFCMEATQFEIKSTLSNLPMQKEVAYVPSSSLMKSELNTHLERESRVNIKEEPWCLENMSCEIRFELEHAPPLNAHLENGLVYVSCDSVTEPQNMIDLERTIKEEPLWKEGLTESKDGGNLQDDIKDTGSAVNERGPEVSMETQRSCAETISNCVTNSSTLSVTVDLQENGCLKIKEDNLDCKISDFAVQLKKNSDTQENNEEHAQIEIKEETWWLDRTSVVKPEPEDILLRGADVQNNKKDSFLESEELTQESLSTESSRLWSSGCDVISADLSNKACLKLRENTACEKATMCAADGDSTTEPSNNVDKPVYMLVFVPANLKHLINQTHLCKICNKTFTTPTGLKTHILKHEGKLPHKCTICEKTFAQASKLKLHMLIHDGIRPHKCKICDKSFTTLSNLKEHNFIHEGESPHKCNVCEKCFTTAYSLKVHYLIHEGKRPHKCKICEKTFTQASNLRMHNLIHEGKRPHKCNICGKCFTVASKLKVHNLIHEGKRPHKCKICGKSFIVASELNAHNFVHDGKGPHKCKTCEKSFTRASMLKRHVLVHEDKRAFKCKICEKGFSRASNLKTHTMIHEGKLPHKCKICERSFTHASKLKRHNLIHEGKQSNV